MKNNFRIYIKIFGLILICFGSYFFYVFILTIKAPGFEMDHRIYLKIIHHFFSIALGATLLFSNIDSGEKIIESHLIYFFFLSLMLSSIIRKALEFNFQLYPILTILFNLFVLSYITWLKFITIPKRKKRNQVSS